MLRQHPISTLFPYTTLFRSNTSSAVEQLTVSMKQVSNNAEASAEAARRALDAAEQGNRSVHDTLEGRSEEHTSELQSRRDLVCRLLLEKKKTSTSCWCAMLA